MERRVVIITLRNVGGFPTKKKTTTISTIWEYVCTSMRCTPHGNIHKIRGTKRVKTTDEQVAVNVFL